MTNIHTFRGFAGLTQGLAVIMLLALPLSTLAAVGKIEFSAGAVSAKGEDGKERAMGKGAEVQNGDTIITKDTGRAQVRFSDGGYISLQPDTEFKVEDYSFNGKADGTEKSVFNLLKGGLRAVTGTVGKANKDKYQVKTGVATIGIRGTGFLATFINGKLLVRVSSGAVFLQNSAGNLVIYRGQSGAVNGANSSPQQTTETPSVTSQSPGGTTTVAGGGEDTDSVYIDGNIRLAGDQLCQTEGSDCSDIQAFLDEFEQLNTLLQGGVANIPALNAANAYAVYTGTSSIYFSMANNSAVLSEALIVDFGTYETFLDISGTFDVTGGSYDGKDVVGFTDGTINSSTAVMTFNPGQFIIDPTGSPVMGNLNVTTSSLNSSNLSQATIGYTVDDNSSNSDTVAPHVLNGTAFPSEPSPE